MTDMYNMIMKFPELLTTVMINQETQDTCIRLGDEGIDGILIVGMGGSAISGLYVQGLLHATSTIPIVVNRDYTLPAYVDSRWVTIAISYSGNTEETLTAYESAIDRDCPTFILTSGGQLSKKENTLGKIMLPSNYQPRAVFPAIFSTVLNLVENLLGKMPSALDTIGNNISEMVKKWEGSSLSPKVMAQDLSETVPIFIGARHLIPVAYRAKCQINENAKGLAFYSVLPEANHNEIEGFVKGYSFDFTPIFLRSSYEDKRISQRFDITSSIYENEGYTPIRLSVRSSNIVEEMLAMTFYLDWMSTELAEIKGVDPTSVERISTLKERLK
ncbi:MAG: bifunctional phosphoglucose/phosphomannose isomerase [Promethearchaeota archaeon]